MSKKTLLIILIVTLVIGFINCKNKTETKTKNKTTKTYMITFPWGISPGELKAKNDFLPASLTERVGYVFFKGTKKLSQATIYFVDIQKKSKFDESYHNKKYKEIQLIMEKDYGKSVQTKGNDEIGKYTLNTWETKTTKIYHILYFFKQKKLAGKVKHGIDYYSKKYMSE